MKLSFFELGEAFESSINKKKLGLNHFKKGFGCKSYPYYKSEIIKNKYKDLLIQILYKRYFKHKTHLNRCRIQKNLEKNYISIYIYIYIYI